MTDDELIKRVVSMLDDLRALGGSDRLYLFSPFFKPIDLNMSTIFGALFNFPAAEDFSEDKISGFKAIVNRNSDILVGYVRIGDQVYLPQAEHEYKQLLPGQRRELIKALVSRAVKITKFDLSMMSPGWLDGTDAKEPTTEQYHVYENELEEIEEIVADEPTNMVEAAIDALRTDFGDFQIEDIQIQEMSELLSESIGPYALAATRCGDGISITASDSTGIVLYVNEGKLHWEY